MKRRLSLDSPPQIKKQKRSPKAKPSPTFSDQELEDLTRLIEEDFSDKELEELNLLIEEDLEEDDFADIITPQSSPKTLKFPNSPDLLSTFMSPNYPTPTTHFWSIYGGTQYNKIGNVCYSYIVNKYKNSFTSCVTESIEFIIDNRRGINVKEIRPYYGFNRSLQNCIGNQSTFIIIPYGLYFYDPDTIHHIKESSGHRCLVIVNNILKTVEFFDPNGYDDHEWSYQNKDYDLLNEILVEFKSYKKLSFNVSCPKLGFQAYESSLKTKVGDMPGYCVIWSWFIADLRLKYPEIEPGVIQQEYIEELIRKQGKNLSSYLRDFIIKYASYVYSKVKPTTPSPRLQFESPPF